MKNKHWIFAICILFAMGSISIGASDKHKVTYELEGGYNSILNPKEIEESQLPVKLQNPKRSGYSFCGWYKDINYTEKIYEISEDKNQIIFAKWCLNIDSDKNIQEYPYENNDEILPLKDLSYSFLETLATPGNPRTRVDDMLADRYESEYQCPQGFCVTPEFYIVSSYAMENDCQGALTLYDRLDESYVMTFGMEAKSHLGGVCFDGDNLWVCHSDTKTLECISYEFIKEIASISEQNYVDITNCFKKYKVSNTPSCIAFYNGILYVATFRNYAPGILYCYEFLDNTLQLKDKFLVPPKVQGIHINEENQVWLSLSYGRNKSSYIWMYDSFTDFRNAFFLPRLQIEAPPGSEAIFVEEGVCYVLFETASYKYYEGSDGKGRCKYPIDKILRFATSE